MYIKSLLPLSVLLLSSAVPSLAAFLQCPPNIQSACQRSCHPCGRSSQPTCSDFHCEERCQCRGDTPPPPYPNPNPPPYPGPRPPSPSPPKRRYRRALDELEEILFAREAEADWEEELFAREEEFDFEE